VEFYQAPIQSFPNPIKDQMEVDYSLQQSFPFPGKITSRIEVEHEHARMGEAERESLKRKVIREAKTRYYELYLLDRRREFNRDDQALLNRFLDIARKQYEVGMGRQADILKAQTELTRLKADSITLAQSRRSMEGMLNALLNRRTSAGIRVADSLAPALVTLDWEGVRTVLQANHPDLAAMRAMVEMREAERTMARKELLPDFMVRGMYKDMWEAPAGHGGDPEDFWAIMVGMNFPLAFWSAPKYQAGLAHAKASLNQAREEYADMENMALAKAQEALLKARSNAELAKLSRSTLLPQAQQTLESNLAAYQSGRGDFMMLLDAYRMRIMARENAEMALMQLLVSEAELEEAVGLDMDELKEKVAGGMKK
jgi:outer membrane protein, heavy metal efflux system